MCVWYNVPPGRRLDFRGDGAITFAVGENENKESPSVAGSEAPRAGDPSAGLPVLGGLDVPKELFIADSTFLHDKPFAEIV